jgi:hypothetical protein
VERGLNPININYDIYKQAVISMIKTPPEDLDEYELIQALKAKSLNKTDIDEILKMIEMDTSKTFVNLRIFCAEKIKDFV